jgi:hypothetical protein
VACHTPQLPEQQDAMLEGEADSRVCCMSAAYYGSQDRQANVVTGGSDPDKDWYFCLLHSIQISSGAHSASWSKDAKAWQPFTM